MMVSLIPYLDTMAVLTVSEPTFCIPSFRSAFVAPFTGREPVEFLAFSSHCLLLVVGQPEGKGFVERHDRVWAEANGHS